jgi:hypothetical protein
MEDNPMLAIPFIMVGMIFSILCTYGMWNVEYFYIGYNASIGNTSSYFVSTDVYGDPYSYIFVLMFFVFTVLFVKTGFNMWRDALETKAEMDYNMKMRKSRKF